MTNNPLIRVALVDDSQVIRKMLFSFVQLNTEMKVIAQGENGQEAVNIAAQEKPDVMLLDVEMPVMDGLVALPEILKASPNTKVIMVSTLTGRNAAVSVKALSSGASDHLQKPSSAVNVEQFEKELINKILSLALHPATVITHEPAKVAPTIPRTQEKEITATASTIIAKGSPKALAIGCSTGGPQALGDLFKDLKNDINDIPTFITQHMPAQFTKFLAENISRIGFRECVEGKDGEVTDTNKIYLAPGDFHMTVSGTPAVTKTHLNQDDPVNFCRPSVDPMLKSLADIYGNELLVLIMTGMGSDGLDAVKYARAKKTTIIIQDSETNVM